MRSAVATVDNAVTETSRELVSSVDNLAPRNPSNPREPEMLESINSVRKAPGLRRSDAIAGALFLGVTMQVFAGPIGGLIGAIAGAAAGTAVFPRIFPHHQNGSKRPVK